MKRENELQAGLFILITLVLFIISIFTLGSERQIFSRQEEYQALFNDVKGLKEGAPVRLGGIAIGRVAKIGFSPNLKDALVHVSLLINEQYLERIRSDSVVKIQTQGLLGDRFVSISMGSESKQLAPGATLKVKEEGDIGQVLTQAGAVVDNVANISEEISHFLKNFREEMLGDLSSSITSLSRITKAIEEGDGLAHQLFFGKGETGGSDILTNLSAATSNVKDVTEQLRNGDGLINALIYDRRGKKTVKTLTLAAASIADTAEKISALSNEIIEGEGLLHDLIYAESPDGVDQIIAKLNQTAENLNNASEAIASGSGTIGALLIDSKLYDNLVEVTDGAKRSVILRHAIRSSLEKK